MHLIQLKFVLFLAVMCSIAWAGGVVFQMDQAASSYPTFLWHIRECGEVANLDRRFGLCARRHHQEAHQPGRCALYFATDSVGHSVRENAHPAGFAGHQQSTENTDSSNQLNLFDS